MTITLTPEIEQKLTQEAEKAGMTPEALALARLLKPAPMDYRDGLPPPQDDWERELRSIGIPCGISLTDEQLSREVMYDDHL